MTYKIKQAVIPAAGLGTRFLPATKVVPKELLPIVDRPSIQYVVEEALSAGVEEIIFVISKGKEDVVRHFQTCPELEAQLKTQDKSKLLGTITRLQDKARFTTVYQEKPLGLGHAVAMAADKIGDDWFFIFLPDDVIDHEVPCAQQMLNEFNPEAQGMVAVMPVPWERVHQYGVVAASPVTTQIGHIENFVEKPKRELAPSNLAIIGRYILPKKIFGLLAETKPGAIGEIQLTDALIGLIENPGMVAFTFEGERFDVGAPLGLLEANLHMALKNPELSVDVKKLLTLHAESR